VQEIQRALGATLPRSFRRTFVSGNADKLMAKVITELRRESPGGHKFKRGWHAKRGFGAKFSREFGIDHELSRDPKWVRIMRMLEHGVPPHLISLKSGSQAFKFTGPPTYKSSGRLPAFSRQRTIQHPGLPARFFLRNAERRVAELITKVMAQMAIEIEKNWVGFRSSGGGFTTSSGLRGGF